MWNTAEDKLREVLNEYGCSYKEAIGEAAFYGPKLDFLLPRRFDLSYIDKDGSKKTPVVIHRAIFGTFDRFTAFLMEETKGAFPLWLCPTEVNIIPVNNDYHLEYAKEVYKDLDDMNIRVNLDDRNEKLSYKMRESQTKKNPITLILGDKEVENNTISYRKFGSTETYTLPKSDFYKLVKETIDARKQNI